MHDFQHEIYLINVWTRSDIYIYSITCSELEQKYLPQKIAKKTCTQLL